jgi:hypothetical protein
MDGEKYIIEELSRGHNRYEFCQCPFDKLKDAKQYINENKNKRLFKYWQIVRQEYFTDKLGVWKNRNSRK